jgi:hypothetical protein
MRTARHAARALVALGALATLAFAVTEAPGTARARTLPPAPQTPALGRSVTAVRTVVRPVNLLRGRPVVVAGAVLPARARRRVIVQERYGRRWIAAAGAVTNARGLYRVTVWPQHLGSLPLRVRFGGDALALAAVGPVRRLNVYRLAGASWYGPGGSLACGGWLSDSTLGVANKTLPCGTLVTLHLGHRTVRVPVIDRGPYVAGRDFDLTPATKRALGFGDVGDIWASA